MADDLSRDDAVVHEQLLLARKWQPAGWKDGRMEAQGETQAKDADFLISFASPDSGPNNKILHRLKEGVLFDGKTRPVRFCTDRSLGMGVHVVPGKASQRWDPKYSNLEDPRQPGDFPNWFKHYKEAAEETKHGILILQLTESYFKFVSQVSKACRWEFGYIRKPELVHLFVDSEDGPQIVHWQDLMQDADLCSRAFGVQGASPQALQQAADIMVSESVKTDLVHETVAAAAKLVEEQEYQAWCALPLREVAYVLTRNQEKTADGIVAANELLAVYLRTGQAHKAAQLGARLLEVVEELHGPEE
ncbi:NPHP3, partial [Symbiodinium necroappetens]